MQSGPGGEAICLSGAPGELPAVTWRDLEQAWEIAQMRRDLVSAGGYAFRFGGVAPVELVVADRDAASWVAALERRIGIASVHGVSLCLRLLGLVALMAEAGWARDWFVLAREGVEIRPELLRAAAGVKLNAAGGFDETALKPLLPAPAERRG